MQANPEALEAVARKVVDKLATSPLTEWDNLHKEEKALYLHLVGETIAAMPAAPRVAELVRLLDHASYLLGIFGKATHTDQLTGSDLRAAERAAQDIRTALGAKPSPGCEHKAVAGSICGDMG